MWKQKDYDAVAQGMKKLEQEREENQRIINQKKNASNIQHTTALTPQLPPINLLDSLPADQWLKSIFSKFGQYTYDSISKDTANCSKVVCEDIKNYPNQSIAQIDKISTAHHPSCSFVTHTYKPSNPSLSICIENALFALDDIVTFEPVDPNLKINDVALELHSCSIKLGSNLKTFLQTNSIVSAFITPSNMFILISRSNFY